MESKPGRKRDQSVEHDRLRIIIQIIMDQGGMNPSKLVREAGFDTSTKEGRAAYQAIKRWSEGREAKGQEEKPAKGKPAEKKRGEYFPRHLKLEYREILFEYIKTNHWTEYIKPMPPGETWITQEELIFWLADWNRSGQSGEPVQEWTGDMGKLFDEAYGENTE